MNSNNSTSQDYSDLPTYQADNISTLFHNNNNNNDQHTSINNVEMSNTFIINTLPALQNDTFEFYFPLPNSARIYYVTYTELHPLENARLLNNSINLSRIPDHQLPHHYNLQSLIRQQIQQQGQQPVYQQNNVQQQFDITIQPTSDTNNNAYNATSNSVINGTISDNIQDTEFQNSY
ncbi:unnamed protein product [Rhizophagus irregularis]|nr:unnamed protein product [Rhizophagus irregularis]CAB5356841.1 unnamed protein product [Rhizophagus irregularis]